MLSAGQKQSMQALPSVHADGIFLFYAQSSHFLLQYAARNPASKTIPGIQINRSAAPGITTPAFSHTLL
ncbi:hypothetical protein ES15_1942 [Cronobacter sakazakii ES15]|nr:hypothetical protein ES15_1942 [Cronobacter sakazakii ES15]